MHTFKVYKLLIIQETVGPNLGIKCQDYGSLHIIGRKLLNISGQFLCHFAIRYTINGKLSWRTFVVNQCTVHEAKTWDLFYPVFFRYLKSLLSSCARIHGVYRNLIILSKLSYLNDLNNLNGLNDLNNWIVWIVNNFKNFNNLSNFNYLNN